MKKIFIGILVLCAVVVLGFAGYRGYAIWNQQQLIRQANECLLQDNLPGAMIALRNLLAIDHLNYAACRLMGDLAEKNHSDQVVEWRRRLVQIEPESFTNRLMLARSASQYGDFAMAQRSLDGVSAADKQTAIFHQTQGEVALASQRLDDAQAQLTEAEQLDPNNPRLSFELATVRLFSTNASIAAQGLASLQHLATNPSVRMDSLRQLAEDALRHTNTAQALAYSRQVLAETNAEFSDRLVELDLLRLAQDPRQSEFLTRLQGESSTSPLKSYQLGKWLLANSKPERTLAWIQNLPASTRTNLPLPLLETDCRMLLKDWKGLLTTLSAQSWGANECGRLIACLRAYKELGQISSAKITWFQALKSANNQPMQLQELLEACTRWNWPAEQLEVLWTIVNNYPDNTRALQVLVGRLYAEGQTHALMSLSSQALLEHPNELGLMNNLAATALLLEAWEKKPHQIAREIYTRCPTNANYMVTYAYSLMVQKHPADALKIMEQINPVQLEEPGTAAYYGLILNAVGQREKALHYMNLALQGRLLPEERKLVERAKGYK